MTAGELRKHLEGVPDGAEVFYATSLGGMSMTVFPTTRFRKVDEEIVELIGVPVRGS